MEIHYVGWRGLVDVVHLEASEITAVHQTTHPSWAGPPSDAFIIAGWDVLRVPLHGNAGLLCELLGLELRKTEPNLADLYVKQGDMSGSRPREALQDADFEGYRDPKRPYGAFFLSTFVWFFILILSIFRVRTRLRRGRSAGHRTRSVGDMEDVLVVLPSTGSEGPTHQGVARCRGRVLRARGAEGGLADSGGVAHCRRRREAPPWNQQGVVHPGGE